MSKYKMKTRTIEVTTLHEFLVEHRGNQTKAAKDLGINRGTLRKYLPDVRGEKHHINLSGAKPVFHPNKSAVAA